MDPRGLWHRRCQSLEGGRSVCPNMCVRQGKARGGEVGGGRLSMVLTLPEWSYCQAPVHLLPWQQQWPRCCHGEVDTKRRGVGTGPGVRSEGQGVKGHSQLDSTQEEARVRKGGKVWFSFSLFLPFLPCDSAGKERSDEWTSPDINIELGRWDESRWGWGAKGGSREEGSQNGAPQRPGFGGLACIRPDTYWCLIAHSIWQPIDSGQCTRKCDYWEDVDGCMCVCVAAACAPAT